MEQNRKPDGKYGKKKWSIEKWLFFFVMLGAFSFIFGHLLFNPWFKKNTVSYTAPIAEAAEIEVLTVAQLEARLDAIVWKGESGAHTMEDGEIFPVFDPSSSMYQQCIRIGSRQHKDCISYGPRQEKIGTIQHYYPILYGKTVSDREARDIAEGNESSKRFFLDCAVKIKGCANNWTTFAKHQVEGQLYIDLIREAKGITIE